MKRPKNFSWLNPEEIDNIQKDRELSSATWNRFTNRINEFRLYKKLETMTYTYARKGMKLSAKMYNETVNGVNDMINNKLPQVDRNQVITPEHIYSIINALNSIDAHKFLGDERVIVAHVSSSFIFDTTKPPVYDNKKGYCTERITVGISAGFTFDTTAPQITLA